MARKILRGGDIIELSGQDGTKIGKWQITDAEEPKEGGSSVCYSAVHCGIQGRLKEFCPFDDDLMEFSRDADNQLVAKSVEGKIKFNEMKKDFIRNYLTLQQIKLEDYDNTVLNNYMPVSEILYGKPQNGGGSVYIWTQDDKAGITIDEYFKNVSRSFRQNADSELYRILCIMSSLTDFVKALHYGGFVHLDIKPSNFLLPYNGDRDINENAISAFDINSLRHIDCRLPQEFSGTRGFSAPECERGQGNDLSDIYSIGASLFYGICLVPSSDGMANLKYTGDFQNIAGFIKNSYLIQSLKSSRKPYIESGLENILQKCLHKNPRKRYISAKYLQNDLKKLIVEAAVYVKSENLDAGKELAIVEKEEKSENVKNAISNLLFERPIYSFCKDKELNVLVIGIGNYGQTFLDLCLQAGQMYGYNLRISAYSDNAAMDKKIYLSTRPWLGRYVSIDGRKTGLDYGSLTFSDISEAGEAFCAKEDNKKTVQKLLESQNMPTYVFIALGDDELNAVAAADFADIYEKYGICGAVNFAVQSPGNYKKGTPVCISGSSVCAQLEKMAFNVHLTWAGERNPDIAEQKKKFKDPYYYNSSVSNALSVRYKLKNAGADMDSTEHAAEMFAGIISKDRILYNGLVEAEHRRWIVEKVCRGWRGVEDGEFDTFFENVLKRAEVKDRKRKIHHCIVPIIPDTEFDNLFYENEQVKKEAWDNYSAKLSYKLGLNRLSVKLHRRFYSEAIKLTGLKRNPEEFDDLRKIENTLSEVPEARILIDRYKICIKKILSREHCGSSDLKSIAEELKNLVPKGSFAQNIIKGSAKNIEKELFPVIESSLYRDYKKYDEDLVKNVPFIFTYKAAPNMIMFFENGNCPFDNVTAASVIKPGALTYICRIEQKKDIDTLAQNIRKVQKYFAARHMNCDVRLFVLNRLGKESAKTTEKTFSASGLKCTAVFCRDEKAEFDAATGFLAEEESKAYTIFNNENGFFDKDTFLQKFGKMAYCEFCEQTLLFKNTARCDYLKYINDRSYLRVSDVTAFAEVSCERSAYPEYADDYEKLWEIYKGCYLPENKITQGAKNWESLCKALANHPSKTVCANPADKSDRQYSCYFPGFCFAALNEVLAQLKKYNAVKAESYITFVASDSCKAEILENFDINGVMHFLMQYPHMLNKESVKVSFSDTKLTIELDSPVVENLCIDTYVLPLLQKMEEYGYINCLKEHGGMVSFVYASNRIKKLMHNTENIAKIYLYYKLNDCFDDVVFAAELTPAEGGKPLSLDFIGCTGFDIFLIKWGCAEGMHSFAKQFGSRCRKTIITNTDDAVKTEKIILQGR